MKKIKYLGLAIGTLFFLNNKVYAGSSISTSASQVSVGSSFTVTASVSGVASWNIHVSASGPVSGCSINAADATETAANGSKSYSAKCTATGTGTIRLTLSGDTTTAAGSTTGISGSRTVSVVAKSSGKSTTNNKTTNNNNNNSNSNNKKTDNKSSNTNLEEFGVKDYKVSPEFSNSKNDYTLTVPYDTNKITIYTTRSSKKQTVSGTGEKEVKEGENKFIITVTAEDGTKRTINLTVTVDSKPITVIVDGIEYTVVKKKEELPELNIEHEDIKLTIEDQEVDAYRIDKINYVLIGLKDSEGIINYYKFDSYKNDEKPAEYKLVRFLNINDKKLIYLDFPKGKIPEGYKKYKITINEIEYEVYKLSKDSKYSLIYALNVETGKENIYRYEETEGTIQIYTNEEVKAINKTIEQYQKLIMILGGVIVFLLLLTTIGFTKKGNKIKDDSLNKVDILDIEKLNTKDEKKLKKEIKKTEKAKKKRQKKGEPDM